MHCSENEKMNSATLNPKSSDSTSALKPFDDIRVVRGYANDSSRMCVFPFQPLRLSCFQKEMEEAENEPLPTFVISPSEDETEENGDVGSDVDILANIQGPNESENEKIKVVEVESVPSVQEVKAEKIKMKSCFNESPVIIPVESVDNLNVNVLNVMNIENKSVNFTPNFIKPPKESKYVGDFVTPKFTRSEAFVAQNYLCKTDRFVTGAKREEIKDNPCPKVQCTVKMGSLFSAPFSTPSTKAITQKLPNTDSKLKRNIRSLVRYAPIIELNGILQEKNVNNLKGGSKTIDNIENYDKENVHVKTSRVQFSPPLSLPQFDTITVRNVKYIILTQMGVGGSSVVYNCFDPESKCERAIKKVRLIGDKSLVSGYINEVKMLEKLQKCDRIIKMYAYEILESEKLLLMVLEKGDADLSKILKSLSNSGHRLPMFKLICYWMEMLNAVKQIHENDIVHSDLKPSNFLQLSDGLKLIDFGIASCIQSDMTSVIRNVPVGSFNYISPEALSSDSSGVTTPKYRVNYKSDVWSLGCILYQLVYRRTPFQHISHPYAKISAIIDPQLQIKYPEITGVPLRIISTIKLCLQHDMKSRPTVCELIQQMNDIY